jgi:diguanylate cyclase (GGDEF)-like protein
VSERKIEIGNTTHAHRFGDGSAADQSVQCLTEPAPQNRQVNDWAADQLHNFLSGMSHAARLMHDLSGLSQFTVELTLRHLSSRRGSLMVFDNHQILRILAARGLPDWVIEQTGLRLGEGIAGRVASAGRPLLVEDSGADPQRDAASDRYRSESFLSVPLPGEQQVLGVVNVTEPLHGSPFQRRDLEQLVNIADSVGLAIDRAIRYREAEELAVRDELTGLYNRRYLWRFLDSILDRAREESFPVTLLLFDIDHFKQFNDQYGHPAGDDVLREVANLMRQNFRAHDVICRLGGEEFAVILWDGRGEHAGSGWQGYPTTAFEFAERLRLATMSHRFNAVNRSGLTLSGGLATFPWDGLSRTELVEQADAALYRAKRDGRNRVYLCGQIRAC